VQLRRGGGGVGGRRGGLKAAAVLLLGVVSPKHIRFSRVKTSLLCVKKPTILLQ
jgi:hypothetical protein